MEFAAGVKATYTRTVPGRWRALLEAWTGKRRCNSGSQCERQSDRLQQLVRAHAERLCAAPPPARGVGRIGADDDTIIGTDDAEAALLRACVALLDLPDRFLTMRHTTALAHETLLEALLRLQQQGGARYDEDVRLCCIWQLERLERHLRTRFKECPGHTTSEAQERALLVHMGRGVELAERCARARPGSP
jgi:hypothetical protein